MCLGWHTGIEQDQIFCQEYVILVYFPNMPSVCVGWKNGIEQDPGILDIQANR